MEFSHTAIVASSENV